MTTMKKTFLKEVIMMSRTEYEYQDEITEYWSWYKTEGGAHHSQYRTVARAVTYTMEVSEDLGVEPISVPPKKMRNRFHSMYGYDEAQSHFREYERYITWLESGKAP